MVDAGDIAGNCASRPLGVDGMFSLILVGAIEITERRRSGPPPRPGSSAVAPVFPDEGVVQTVPDCAGVFAAGRQLTLSIGPQPSNHTPVRAPDEAFLSSPGDRFVAVHQAVRWLDQARRDPFLGR